MTELAEEQLLPFCPQCTYELRGLPVAGRCPECGFAVDRRWRVFGGPAMYGRRPWWRRPGHALLLALVPSFGIMAAVSVMSRQPWLMLVPLGAAGLIAGLTGRRSRKFVALADDALLVYHGRGRWERYEWPAVGRAENDLLRKAIAWEYAWRIVRHNAFWIFGMDLAAVDACVRAINARNR